MDHIHDPYVWRMRGSKVRLRCAGCGETTGWFKPVPIWSREERIARFQAMKHDDLLAMAQRHGFGGPKKTVKHDLIVFLLEATSPRGVVAWTG